MEEQDAMEAGDLAAVLVAVVCLGAIVVLMVAVSSLVKTLRTLDRMGVV